MSGLATVDRWIVERSGATVLLFIAALSLALLPLGRLNTGLPGFLIFLVYLIWLSAVCSELRDEGRGWPGSGLSVVPFAGLLVFACVDMFGPSREVVTDRVLPFLAAIAVLSYISIWDHIARAVSSRKNSRVDRIGWYVGTLFLSSMPPFAILLVQHQIRGRQGARVVIHERK